MMRRRRPVLRWTSRFWSSTSHASGYDFSPSVVSQRPFVKANFRSSQLSLPIAIAPAADPPARTMLRDDLPEQLARLTEAERTLLRLKALVGVATNKSDFLTMANASVIAALGGVSLTYNMVNPMLNRLLSLGLLNADFACV